MKTTTLITRRAAILTGSAAMAAGWGRGNFTGTVRTIGPGQQYATLVAAHAAASNGDLLLCAANCPLQTATISKDVWVDFSQCVWDFTNVPSGTLAGGGKGAIEVFGANIRIYAGEITGVGLDLPAADLTSAVRVTSPSGDVFIIGGYFHRCQNGLTSNAGDASITAVGTRLGECGLQADKDHAHNAYFGEMRRISLINVDSRNPLYAHSIKSRAAEFHASGGFFESPTGACFDLPEGGKFTLENLTMQKLATSGDQKFLTYAVENTNEGLTNANWIKGCYFDLQCPNPYFFTQGGTITLLAGNTANGISPSVVGSGTVIGLPISGGTGITPDVITATNLTLIATTSVPVSGVVGSFSCNNSAVTAGQLTGTVDWGEGGGVVAGVVGGSLGQFTVSPAATHTYGSAGAKPAVVSVLYETATPAVTATCTSTMTVSNAVVGSAQAVVTFGSTVYTFNETDATDIGSISDPLAPVLGISSRFTMSCKMRTLPGCPLRVYFRRIASPSFVYIVFELGNALTGVADLFAAYGPYSATVFDGAGNTHTYSNVTHYYFCRWRHVFNTWPFTLTTPATLISAGLVPHFDAAVGGAKITNPGAVNYSGPMSIANIPAYMSGGGEGDNIGLFDGWQGAYLCGINQTQHLADVLAELEGSCSEAWHFRDMTTGAPINLTTYPNASTWGPGPGYGQNPWLGLNYGDANSVHPNVEFDTSHMPDMAYVPFLLQGDPYALEEMQFVANFTKCYLPPGYGDDGLSSGSVRGYSWSVRNRARTVRCTPASVPGWLLPKSYWQAHLDTSLAFVLGYAVNNSAAPFSGLGCFGGDANQSYGGPPFPDSVVMACWMENYFGATVGHLVEMGFSAWMPVFTWCARYQVNWNSGTSGWNRNCPCEYHNALRATATSPYVNTWPDYWALNLAFPAPDLTNGSPAHRSSVSPYDVAQQAVLAIAARQGIAGAAAAKAWLLPEIQTLAYDIMAGWSIA